jgi:low affinity Fe/Cu permease
METPKMLDTRPDAAKPVRFGSQILHIIDRVASRPLLAVLIVAMDLIWVLASIAFGFPGRLETIFQTLVAAVTLAMVFVIQHTQAREQVATQRKLDEILRALPDADNTLIAFEDASDSEISVAHSAHRQLRLNAVNDTDTTK